MAGRALWRSPAAGPSAGPRTGFVLVLVLALLVALTVLAGTVALVAQRLRDDQLARQREWQAEIDMADTRASVLYLLLSQRRTFGGLTVDEQMPLTEDERVEVERSGEAPISYRPVGNEIAFDARPYRGSGGVDFSLREDRGLIGVNWTAPALLARALERLGVEADRRARLSDLLLDYQDPDELYRLNGAERDQYLKAGLPPPSNRTLVTPLELRAVMGWREALAGLDDAALLDTFTVVRSVMINLNTAPASVLMSLPGVDAAIAQRIVDGRRLQPYTELARVVQLAPGLTADSELLSLYPSDSGILRLWPREGGQARVLHWTLTPLNEGGPPWREDYEYSLTQEGIDPGRAAQATAAAVLAEPAAAP